MSTTRTAEFTGRHMLAIMLVFFGLIIGVNVTMAVFASTSWTGLVVKNAYVASQEFNAKAAEARAQAALGLTAVLTIADGTIAYRLIDASGRTVPITSATASFHRPVSTSEDTLLWLVVRPGGSVEAWHAPGDGVWIMEILADAGFAHAWRETRRVVIINGALK